MSAETKNKEIIGELEPGKRTIKKLKHGGFLHVEHDVPFLMIYRKAPDDPGTLRLVRTGASYLILGKDNFDYFYKIVKELTNKMSKRFGTFILIEIYSGSVDSTEFIIRGPSHKLPVSLDVLRNKLEKIKSPKHGANKITAKIEQTKDRLESDNKEFFSIEEIKNVGGTLIGLEVPPVFRDEDEEMYPLYFRKFRDGFAKAIHKSVFEFIRVQAFPILKSYASLGKRNIHEELFKIDKKLTEIENSYQFLLLVAPVNIQTMREKFFKSNFEKTLPFHYRLLPIDPDILKRKLFDLRIDEIDDPALAYLYEEKRDEIDQELTMLKERGSKEFFYRSLRLYKGIEKNVLAEAKLILENVPEDLQQVEVKEFDVDQFAELAQKEFDYFREQSSDYNCKIHIRPDVNIMMVSKGELYLPSDYTMTKKEAAALIQHEVGTHSLTFYNGSQQPLSQLSQGLAGYDSLQEGLAVLSEYLIGGLTANRLRTIAGRVVAGETLLDEAEFQEVFSLLHINHGFSKGPAFNITSRIFQGGGFLKDVIYLRGLVHLREYLQNGGELEELLAGKYALEQVPLIKELIQREILKPLTIKPRYMSDKNFDQRMNDFKDGISFSKMIKSNSEN
ncbi:MAG TPA: tyrosine/phenylalanine carboxypeptidase domain-containing protein [Flavobacteriaceae bacterium]|nr:tyrosine/phenylalanine carboxypeptidase domain-containing protein [Flavobacteriaceae bacterium]